MNAKSMIQEICRKRDYAHVCTEEEYQIFMNYLESAINENVELTANQESLLRAAIYETLIKNRVSCDLLIIATWINSLKQ